MGPYGLMLGGAFAFAVMGAFAHAAGGYCDWQVVALARSGLALLIGGLLAAQRGTALVFFRPKTLWVRSLAGSISVMCTFYALSRLPIADALTLTNMFPLWIALLSWPVLGKFPDRAVWLGIGCGLTGVVVMQQPYLAEGNLGTLAAVLASFSSAVALIGLHRLKQVAPTAVVVHFSTVSVVSLLAMLLIFPAENGWGSPLRLPWPAPALLLGVGLFATAGQLLLTRAYGAGAPTRVAVVGLSQVGFAMVFDTLIWDRAFQLHSLIGILLVMLPTVWLMLRRDGSVTTDQAVERVEPS